MLNEKIIKLSGDLRRRKQLIHCITNPISINQCANAVLSLGARPVMAEHPGEVAEITKSASALLLNLGNITDARISSCKISADIAEKENIPLVIDLVGVACSHLRRGIAFELLEKKPAIIKGNFSEIYAMSETNYNSAGVDADAGLSLREVSKKAKELAEKFHCTVLASGECDIVTDGKSMFYIKNGCQQLSLVTGTGCMLGAICACFLSVCKGIEAASLACCILGVCGEMAQNEKGSGSFMINLLDNLSCFCAEDIKKYFRMEEIRIEEI